MKTTNKISSSLILFGALLSVTGLFLYFNYNTPKTILKLKPSQLDFTKSNELNQNLELAKTEDTSAIPQVPNNINPEKIIHEKNNLIQLSDHEKSAWLALEDILLSKNDNDARINHELKNLSLRFHEVLYEKYNSIAAENRNAKGLIVFLISRDLKSKDDIEFLTKIYQEGPCLSLEDCKNSESDEAHHAGTNQTTLIYPQFVGLYQIENQLLAHPEILNNSVLRHGITSLLQQAEDFPVLVIQQKAQELRRKFNL